MQRQQKQENKQKISYNQVNETNKKEQIDQTICEFYLIRKHRQCKFAKVKGSKFCHSHCSDLEDKVQCPYEKGMFILKSKLQKHLENCPRIRDKNKEKGSIWYKESINQKNQEGQKNVAESIQQSLPCNLKQIQQNSKVINKVIGLFLECFKGQQLEYINSTQKQSLLEKTKDHMQAEQIAQKAANFGLLSDKYIYVEFGAGKGILSYAIANKIKELTGNDSKNILLEREARRNKFDRFFKSNPFFQRYKSDVSDFDFEMLPKTMSEYGKSKCQTQNIDEQIKSLKDCEMIGVCKHMCGQALDISVRGLVKANCKGNILASCCHHLCNFNTYLNPKFFTSRGWTPEQIQTMFKMSSWGTRSHQFDKDQLSLQTIEKLMIAHEKEQSLSTSLQDKIIIGRICKRMIDFGRAQFLKGKLYRYCSDQLTPQNYVIISN